MINDVRNTVLAVINKNNYGYITPSDFNLFAEQAQLDIFEDYFYQFNSQINSENARRSGSGYADIKKGLEEVIDSFSMLETLTHDTANKYTLPTDPNSAKGSYYLVNKVIYGTTEVERVSQSKILYLSSSNLTAPNLTFPAYTLQGDKITVYPETINAADLIKAQYIRYPKVPKWTFQSLAGGEPMFDPSQSDYQDFELPSSDSINLVYKILQYAGISIREGDIVTYAQSEENQQELEEK